MKKALSICVLLVASVPFLCSVGAAAESSAGAFSLEVSGAANFALTQFFDDMQEERNATLNTYGGDISALYACDKNYSLIIRLGYAGGSADASIIDSWVGGSDSHYFDYDLNTFYLTAGVRYTADITEKASLFVGLNMGAINHSIKSKTTSLYLAGDYREFSTYAEHASGWGIVYAAEAGCTIDLSKNTYLMLAYQFSISSATPEIGSGEGAITADFQSYHTVRIGVGFRF